MLLPGVETRISHRVMLAIIRYRLIGFEIRQLIRETIRRRRSRRRVRAEMNAGQLELFRNGKRLLLFLAFLAGNACTQTLVQQSAGTGTAVTLTSTPTAGNLLIATIGTNNSSNPPQTVTSITQTNVTWSQFGSCTFLNGVTNHFADDIWSGVVRSSASTSATINMSVAGSSQAWNFQEWSGLSTGTQPDTGRTNGGNSANPTAPSITPSASGELVIASAIILIANTLTADPGAPYTSLSAPTAYNHSSYYINGSGATTAAVWTQDGTQFCTIIAAFFPAPATGPVNPLLLLGVGR